MTFFYVVFKTSEKVYLGKTVGRASTTAVVYHLFLVIPIHRTPKEVAYPFYLQLQKQDFMEAVGFSVSAL